MEMNWSALEAGSSAAAMASIGGSTKNIYYILYIYITQLIYAENAIKISILAISQKLTDCKA